MANLRNAVECFNARAFAERHGGYKESLNPLSHEYLLPCPKCGSSRLRWNSRKSHWGAWKCWACSISGDTLRLIELLERVDDVDAVALVMDGHVGGNAPNQLGTKLSPSRATPKHAKLTRLPQIAWPDGVDVLADTPLHAPAWEYLRTRGLTPKDLAGQRVGWGRLGWLRDYLVFPVYMDGGLVYWQARAAFEGEGSGFRKTLNPRSVPGCATAQDVLFNYDRARAAQHLVICEGPIDALKVGHHAVALFGKVAGPIKVQRLLRCRALRYTIYLDAGREERECAERLAEQLSTFAPTYLATPPAGYDAGALTVEYNAQVIANAERYHGRRLQTQLG
jgi:hypothetical protein